MTVPATALVHPSMAPFATVDVAVAELQPDDPLYCVSESRLSERVQAFTWSFPGGVLYAVKSNPHPLVIEQIAQAGTCSFDVASRSEVELVRRIAPDAELFFDHPIKSRSDLHAANRLGVEHYTVDHPTELQKILECVPNARPSIQVRLAVGGTCCGASAKFGASVAEAALLLQEVSDLGLESGLGFHLGTQCSDAAQFGEALKLVAEVVQGSGVSPSWVNCGGGFPSTAGSFARLRPHLAAIRDAWFAESRFRASRLVCEPGRALVEDAVTLVLRVRLRKGARLYMNDGRFGAIGSNCCGAGRTYSARAIGHASNSPVEEFMLYGPTCDPTDSWPGKLLLPRNIAEGDWIAIASMGAYSSSVASQFNGMAVGDYTLVS